MWEEEVERIRVLHRRVSERREASDEEEGEEDEREEETTPLVETGAEHVPLHSLPTSGEHPALPTSCPPVGGAKSRLTRPESLYMDYEVPPTPLLLSTWGEPFTHSDHSFSSPCLYGLLSAERPFYHSRAHTIAVKMAKAASHSKAVPLRWDNPDFRVLYRFQSIVEYNAMIADMRAGKLREINVKGEKLRAVKLEPVRVIDERLKCVVEMTFPLACSDEIKHTLKPILDLVGVSRRFIFVPSAPFPRSLEETDTAPSRAYPQVLLTLITSQQLDSTWRKISDTLQNPEWEKCDLFLQPTSSSPTTQDIFIHKQHGDHIPLIALASGQAGKTMEDSIRLTLFCGSKYQSMVKFYSLVLQATPMDAGNHAIFSLMIHPTSILELCLYDSPEVKVRPLGSLTLHLFSPSMAMLIAQVVKQFNPDMSGLDHKHWEISDPCGNRVTIHNRDTMEYAN